MTTPTFQHFRSRRSLLTSLALLGLCAVLITSCGGGSSSTSSSSPANTEVINGITVPPEPNPTINNATVAGVDANNNGVRDDVERVLATKSKTQGDFLENIQLVQTTEKIFKNFDKNSLRNEIIKNACNLKKMGLKNDIRDILLNTTERENAYADGIKKLDGGFYITAESCGGLSDDL
jgi:hypothetical protein